MLAHALANKQVVWVVVELVAVNVMDDFPRKENPAKLILSHLAVFKHVPVLSPIFRRVGAEPDLIVSMMVDILVSESPVRKWLRGPPVVSNVLSSFCDAVSLV